jgi:hypothetical protein
MTLEALSDALDLKDRETEGHSKRVTAYTIAIARAMGLPREQINTIARGADEFNKFPGTKENARPRVRRSGHLCQIWMRSRSGRSRLRVLRESFINHASHNPCVGDDANNHNLLQEGRPFIMRCIP